MNFKKLLHKALSSLCCVALMATLMPVQPAAAAQEYVFLKQDFSSCTVGDFDSTAARALGYTMLKASGEPIVEIQEESGDKFMSIITQRPYIRMASPGGKYMLSVDVRREAASSGLLEIWVANVGANGTLRLRVHENGAFGVINSADSKNYFVQKSGGYANGVYNAERTNPNNVLLEADQWYTLQAIVDPENSTITLKAAQRGKDAFCESVIPMPAFQSMDYIQLDGQDFSGSPIAISIDNIKVTTDAPTSGASGGTASKVLSVDFQSRTAGERVGSDDMFTVKTTENGGSGTREIKVSGGNKYMQMTAWNSENSTSGARVQIQTKQKVDGTFTVEWDYNNVSSTRGQYFETYLRTGGNIRVRIDDQGIVRIRVLPAVLVPGVMEDDVCDVALKTNNWYTFKAVVNDEKIVLDIYDKDNGNAKVDTLTIAQDASVNPKLFDAYNIWFDLWGKQDVKDLTPAAVAVDNFHLYKGTYEGTKNGSIQTPAATPVRDNERSEGFAVVKCASGLENCPAGDMLDVGKYAWYHKAVDYALTNKLMGGYNFYTFGPYDTLTRAQVVQVLYNKEGQPAVSGKHGFTDVPADQWFNNAITWGSQKGVVIGFGDGKFCPNDAVTVEQVAVILHNYSGQPKSTVTPTNVGEYDGWAKEALGWAIEKGILNGVPFTDAKENATRAQTAQMLMNYLMK